MCPVLGLREGYSEDDCDCIQGLVDRVIKKNKLPHNTTTTGTINSSNNAINLSTEDFKLKQKHCFCIFQRKEENTHYRKIKYNNFQL